MNERGQYGHSAGQGPRGRGFVAGPVEPYGLYVGQGSIFGHTPGDVENELDQLHSELMSFGQQLLALTKREEDQVKAIAQKERDEELAAWKVVESFQALANERDRLLALATQDPARNTAAYVAAQSALERFMPAAQRQAAIARSRELSNRRAEREQRALAELPMSQWKRSTWDPFFAGWAKFRGEKKDIPLQTWPLSGTWDRVQDYRTQFVNLYNKAPFAPTGPKPLDADRKDPSITGGIEEIFKIGKYALIGVLGIGAVVALSSVVSNLRSGKDPAEKYVELIKSRRRSRDLPRASQLALPPGEVVVEGA